MRLLRERSYRELFRIGILVKAVDGVMEFVAGILVYFINADIITRTLFYIFHSEVAEAPRDRFWTYALATWHSLSLQGHVFWGLLFMAHGAVKALLAVALLKRQLWAYPVSAVVFALFALYEVYTFVGHASLFLGLLIVLDAVVVGLIIHESHVIKKQKT